MTEANKELHTLVNDTPETTYAKIHNDRYKGLYRQTAGELRQDCGAKEKETPLNYMGERDLALNRMANILTVESEDPKNMSVFANDLREVYEKRMKKRLEPEWVESCLPPAKARKELNGQLEIPLFDVE